jgi:2'-5' RNA ligase
MNNYALVAYLPDPLRKFLDSLRRELVPGCAPHAHVTILPPRPLSDTPAAAIEAVRSRLPEFSPFEVKIAEVEVFAESDVVYLGIGAGHQNLVQMHGALDVGPLRYAEPPYPYHPHITLAQDLTHEQSIELFALARRRWSEFPHSRTFPVESLVFVQNTARTLWVDLARFQLAPTPSVRR